MHPLPDQGRLKCAAESGAWNLQVAGCVGSRFLWVRLVFVLLTAFVMTANAQGVRGRGMDNLKNDLARRLDVSGTPVGSFFESAGVTVQALETPFLTDGGVVKVVNRGPRVERISFVGWAGKDFGVFLSGNPSAFEQLVSRSKVVLPSDDSRAAFARMLLETTANLNFRFQLLMSVNQIPDRPGATKEELDRNAQIRGRYQKAINGPAIERRGAETRVSYFALVVQDLVRFDVDVDGRGKFRLERTILEKDLAMPYIMG